MTFLYANQLKLCMRIDFNVGDSNCRRNDFDVCESTLMSAIRIVGETTSMYAKSTEVVSAKRPRCMRIDLYAKRVKVSKKTVVLRRWGNKVIWL